MEEQDAVYFETGQKNTKQTRNRNKTNKKPKQNKLKTETKPKQTEKGMHSGLKLYEIDAFISWTDKNRFPMSSGASE